MDRSPFSLRLISFRKARNLTQADMAKLLQMNRSTYTCYEIGTSMPNITTLCQIADIFEVDLDYLLGRKTAQIEEEEESDKKKRFLDPVEEMQLVERYRLLKDKHRGIVNDMMKEFSKLNVLEEEET